MRFRRFLSPGLVFLFIAVLASVPPQARAWKVDTHVYAVNLVLEEALSTLTIQETTVTDAVIKNSIKTLLRRYYGNNYGGQSRIVYLDNAWVQWAYYPAQDRLTRLRPVMSVQVPPFGWLRLDEGVTRALFYYPNVFRAGAVGPDLFPDLITGQTVVHPGEGPISGRWAAFLEAEIRRVAGLYNANPASLDETPLLRAYYTGWLGHMAGDLFGHSWVNDYAGGVWPAISDGITDEEKNNILRHLITEAYVSKRIPAAYLTGQRVTMDVPAGSHLTNRYLMTWVTGNGGRIDHDDSEDDRFGINPLITGYASGTPYHLDMLFSIRDQLRRVTRNIDWDALWAGFIIQAAFGYIDFYQMSLLYNHQWFMDVDTALKELVKSQLRTAQRMSAGEGFGAFFDEIERWMMNYGLSALGLPDGVGRGMQMSSDAQAQISNAILPESVRRIFSDLKRQFIDYIMEKAFGVTLTEIENALRDPGTQLRNPALFPVGTKERMDREIGNFGRTFQPWELPAIDFVPFQNTLNMIKLQLIEPAELARVMWAERALPFNLTTEDHVALFVRDGFSRGIQMQFMGSLDAGYNWDRPDFTGCLLWDSPAVRQKIFHRIFNVNRPGAGLGPALALATQKFEVSFPESQFRPRFVWGTSAAASGLGTAGAAQAPPPPPAGGPGATSGLVVAGLEKLPEVTLPDFSVVVRPRPFGQNLAVPEGVHVHPATLAFAEAPPPPPVVLRFFADAKKYVSDGKVRDAAAAAKLAEGGVLIPLDVVAGELGAGLNYDAAKGVATLDVPGLKVELRAGRNDITVNGQKKMIQKNARSVPVAAGATLLVPAGFFEEHLGCRVVSLEKDKTAIIERRKFSDDAVSTVTGEPGAAEAAAPAAAGVLGAPWAGRWETTIGDMDIVIAADNSVNFNYDGEFGRLEGKVDGTRLNGRFVEDNGSRGEIVLTLGRENRIFTGQWRRADIPDDYWHGCEGWRPIAEDKTPALSTAAAGSVEASASAWAGSWDTSLGDMVLSAAPGGLVKGGYDGKFGRIEGQAEGGKLAGRFYEDNGSWGEFVFVLVSGTNAFKGQWRRLNVEGDDWHECEGSKVKK